MELVLDKDVSVEDGVEIKGSLNEPVVLRKGTVQGALIQVVKFYILFPNVSHL